MIPFLAEGVALWNAEQERKERRQQAEAYNANQEAQFSRNVANQREFAQHGLSWKIADAKRAGLHPVYAAGASGASYSPVTVGFDSGGQAGGSFGRDLANTAVSKMSEVGQNLARAGMASATQATKEETALRLQTMEANLEGQKIDNQIRLQQLQKIQGSGVPGPGSEYSIPGQTQSGLAVQEKPFVRVRSAKGMPGTEAGASPGRGMYLTDDGTLVPVPSKDTKEAIEDNVYHETAHFLRNNVIPNISGGHPPPGYYWSVSHQGYRKKEPWMIDQEKGKGGLYYKPKLRRK